MLGNYEKRHFADGETVWLGHYRHLTNVLHWHTESELIHICQGQALIRIGNSSFEASAGDAFFCAGEELHYIIGAPDCEIDILILDRTITKDITDRYTLATPKLPAALQTEISLQKLQHTRRLRGAFYRESLEACARSLLIDIFRSCAVLPRQNQTSLYNHLISKINREYPFITFSEAAHYCGYTPSHFSKVFKSMSGMNFSNYLNIVRIEKAIERMRTEPNTPISAISAACGFSTIRNFNKVFLALTGYSPRSLPRDYRLDTALLVSGAADFDPTQKPSVLL